MSKAIAVLALLAGGAATYAWLQKSGDAGDLHTQVEGAVNKVRDAFSSNDAVEDVRDKANDVANDAAHRVEDVTA